MKGERGSPPSFNFHAIGYAILKEAPARFFPLSTPLREALLKAGMRISYVVYVSSMFFWSAVMIAVSSVATFLMLGVVLPLIGVFIPSFLTLTFTIVAGVAGGGLTLVIFYLYPRYVAGNKRRELERNLVYITNYMTILTSAGATSEEVFASLARVRDVYGVKESARAVMRNIEFLGMDIVEALDEESRRNPSADYADLLQGYISTMRTGGSLPSYLQAMSEKFLESRKRLMDKLINQLNMAGEMFVVALVALPIIMVTIFSIMGIFGGEVLAGLSSTQLIALTVYLMIPFAAVAVFIFIDMIMSSW
ncbi:MAG: type II secretion system F family protein [Candidatus Bathyarchaeia archaeon]